MRKLIICFLLLTLAVAGMTVAFRHAKPETASAILNRAHDEQPQIATATQPHVSLFSVPKPSSAPIASRRPATAPAKQAAMRAFANLPLDFEVNRGQAPEGFDFVAHGPGYVLGLSPGIASLSVQRMAKHTSTMLTPANFGTEIAERIVWSPLELRLVGSSADATASGVSEQPGRSNYFIGNDPSKWQRQVPHFSRVKMAGVYPGVDLDFYGNPQQLEYDFLVSPQANPKNIRLQVQGASRIHMDNAGNAVLSTPAGEVQLKRPVSYQEIEGVRKPVESKFKLVAGRQLEFELAPYDLSKPLVIDPVLIAAVSLGGSNGNQPNQVTGVELDATGNVYVSGYTCATDFPTTTGPFQGSHININAKACVTGFVTKFDPALSTLIYSDFIGGSELSVAWDLNVDSSGSVFVAGSTNSTDFPSVNNIGKSAAPGPCLLSKNSSFSCPDAFVLKLSPDGSNVLFSELLGGSQASTGDMVALNPVTGEVVVLGLTNSSDFQPVTTTLQTSFGGGSCTGGVPCFETFLYGFDPNTGAVRYGTFLGGAKSNLGAALAVDNSGGIYVAGSAQLPFAAALGSVTTTIPPAGGATAAGYDIFVMKLNVSAQNTLSVGYTTVIQGEADDSATALTLDSSGNAYVIGSTGSQHLAVTPGVFQSTNTDVNGDQCPWAAAVKPFLPNSCGSIFLGKFGPTGTLSFLTYLGGSGPDWGQAIALDSLGNVWLGGVTSSTNFPVSPDAYLTPTLAGGIGFTPYLAEMSNDGTKLPFSTLIAGSIGQVSGMATDGNDNVYIAGYSSSVPTTPGVFPPNPQVFEPGFLQKWNGSGKQPALQLSAKNLNFPDTAMGGLSPSQTVTVSNTGAGVMELAIQLQQGIFTNDLPTDFIETNNCGTSLAANATCTITVAFQPGTPSIICLEQPNCSTEGRGAQIIVTTNAPGSPSTIQLGGNSGNGAIFSVSPNPIVFSAQVPGTTSAPLDVVGENSGDLGMTASNVAITGTNAADFSATLVPVASGFPPCTNKVGPGTFCQLEVTFNPAANATGTRTAMLLVTDTAGGSPQSFPISGLVAATALDVSPTSISFGPESIGNNTFRNVTLGNPTTTAVTVSALTITGDTADFTVANASCPSLPPFTVAGGASCIVQVHFRPTAGPSGLRTATLGITSPQVSGIPSVALTAEAVSNTDPALTYFSVPSPLVFGTVPLGQTSNNSSDLLVIDNTQPIPCVGGGFTCGAPLIITAITPGISDFIVSAPQGNSYCTAPPLTIPTGGSCTIPLLFSPTAVGARNSSLVITSNDPQGPVSIPVSGMGVAIAIAEVSPAALIFGSSQIAVISPPQIVTLQNVGRGVLNSGTVTASANFTVSANNCVNPVPPGGSCTVTVTFTPSSAGPFAGLLTFTNDAGFGGKQVVSLSGTGATGALLLISPPALQFGNQPPGTISLPQTVTLTSTGNAAVTLPANAIRISTDFVISGATCGITLAPGASCIIAVQFEPSPGSFFFEPGSVIVTDNAPGNPQSVSLTGNTGTTGSNPTATTLISSANPVAAGQSVTFTAKVSAQINRIPTGPVLFLDGVNTIGSVFLDATGQAILTTSSLVPGSHSITAAYTGGFQFLAATSAAVNQVITGTAPPAATTTTVTSNNNPSTLGQSVMFTATVARTTAGTPTGTVSFMDGSITVGTDTLNGSVMATLQTSLLAVGSHSITAVYGGDANFSGSTSPIVTQVVNATTNPVPAITSLSPTGVAAGSGGFTLTVNGTNFIASSVVNFNGSARVTAFVSATQLTAAIPVTDVASVGTPSVTVTNPTPGGGTSNAVNFSITAGNNPVPTITSLLPSGAMAGSGALTLVVNGTNFISGSVVNFNGTARVTTFLSANQVTAPILASDVATVGTPPVTVTNPTPGGGTSNSVNFNIAAANNPVPAITSLSPNTVSAGSAAFTLTVNGSNFISTSVVQWNGGARTTTFVSATQLTAAITAADVQTANIISVDVLNPGPGGGNSNTAFLNVTTPIPALSSLVPNSAIAGGPAFTLTVNGGNFLHTSVVQWNGGNRATTFVSATQLTAAITAADILAAGTASVKVFTPTVVFGGVGRAQPLGTPSGTTSNVLTFTITAPNPVPTLTTIAPTSTGAGGAAFTLTLTGTNFISSSVAQWKGSAQATTFVSATQLTAAITAADIASSGTAAITVLNPTPGGGTSNALTFTITDFSVSATTTTQTVTAGQSGTFTIATATVIGAFPGTVSFTASGLPTGASASFNPSSVTAGASTTMTITTTARGLAQIAAPPSSPNTPMRPQWLIAFMALVAFVTTLALATTSIAKFGRRTARRLVPAAFALLLISVGYISGCSGGGFPKVGSNLGTPAGSYTITVTGTSGTDVHSTTVTLVVQ